MSKNLRRLTPTVAVGGVLLGSSHPVVVQAMTDTLTADVKSTLEQTRQLVQAGAEMVRWTINDEKAALAAVEMIRHLRGEGILTPVIGDFHFNGHEILAKHEELARSLDKYRINPGNVGRGDKHDVNFAAIIRIAVRYGKAVRIGVNGGSLDPEMVDAHENILDAMVESALASCRQALALGLSGERLVLSAKMSSLQDTVAVYERLAKECDHVLHLGLTEAGGGVAGVTASAAALSILLQQGIGDTIRISLTPEPGVPRAREVEVCRHLLQSMGFRYFAPHVTSCPGCGRTKTKYFQELARDVRAYVGSRMPAWKEEYPGVERLTIAVMGCVVNGPGESAHADIGISLPGDMEEPAAPVYSDGKKVCVLKGDNIGPEFLAILEEYIARRFS